MCIHIHKYIIQKSYEYYVHIHIDNNIFVKHLKHHVHFKLT
jgi:hypothetical protein